MKRRALDELSPNTPPRKRVQLYPLGKTRRRARYTKINALTSFLLDSEELSQCGFFRFLTLKQWSAFFHPVTHEPLDPWVELHFAKWGRTAAEQINWEKLSRHSLPWTRVLFCKENLHNVRWKLFLANYLAEWKLPCIQTAIETGLLGWELLSEYSTPWMRVLFTKESLHKVNWTLFLANYLAEWTLPILLQAAEVDLLAWHHWKRLAIFSAEWMLQLLDKHVDKISFKEFVRHGEENSAARDSLALIIYHEVSLPQWKVEFVKRHLSEFDWSEVCRNANSSLLDVYEARSSQRHRRLSYHHRLQR